MVFAEKRFHLVVLTAIHLSLYSLQIEAYSPKQHIWAWECEDDMNCVKKNYTTVKNPLSYNACHLVCNNSVLWPYPSGDVNISKSFISITPQELYIASPFKKGDNLDIKAMFRINADNFVKGIVSQIKKKRSFGSAKKLIIGVKLENMALVDFTQETDESYSLDVKTTPDGKMKASITANNFFGARHGLETLRQLIVYDPFSQSLIMPKEIHITDAPMYEYRGILLDTSRHFISIPVIKLIIEGMSANKLNTFHWHIVDSQSFPFTSRTYPQFNTYGTFSEDQIYSEAEMKDVVRYGLIHGVRVLPEFDGPAHVGEGWQWTPDNTVVCFKQEPWQKFCTQPPCGQLNPTSDTVYQILKGIYSDMDKLFPSDLFHMGGDEVNLNCWNSSSTIIENMAKMGLNTSYDDFHELWSIFQKKAVAQLDSVTAKPKKIILWTSTLTADNVEKYLDKDRYIIQIWTRGNSTIVKNLLKKGYSVIFSNYDALYLDCGFGNWAKSVNNWCSPYIIWQKVYENDLKKLVLNMTLDWESVKHQVLGSEATLWTETADDSSASNRIWPRGAAMAETLWTGNIGTWLQAKNRMNFNRERMVTRGFDPDTIQPTWCGQNEGLCYLS